MNNITNQTYEDPEVVEGYIQKNSLQPKQAALLEKFAKSIQGENVLDLGCGPGHDSYIFAELNFNVTGLDYSHEMIKRAKNLKHITNQPNFLVGDMTKLKDVFPENSFDAVWANASLLHIRKNAISSVLSGIIHVAKPKAKIFISLKQGKVQKS